MSKEPVTALVGAIQKFSTEDGPGIRTTVFLKGCPLNCKWCHNPELIEFEQHVIKMPNSCIKCGYCIEACPKRAIFVDEEQNIQVDWEHCDHCLKCTEICYAKGLQPIAKEMTPEQVLYEVEQDKGFYDHTGGGMTISGGEILSHPRFVQTLVDQAGARGINVCLDTSGFGDGDYLVEVAQKTNVTDILYDIKAMDKEKHVLLTGKENTLILENLRRLAALEDVQGKIQIRMPLIKGINDSWAEIQHAAALYKELGLKKITLLPYHNLGVSKKRNIGGVQEVYEPPAEEYIDKIKNYFAKEARMDVEILGKLG